MISVRAMYFLVAVAVFIVIFISVVTYYLRRRHAKKYPYGSWGPLLKRLSLVDRDAVALIAHDFVGEIGHGSEERHAALGPERILSLIGGLAGLEILRRNCAVLIDMAFYVQQWYPEALIIAEQLRLNARELEWHVERLEGAAKVGKLESAFPEYGQRAIAIYYSMTKRLLALYEQGNLPELVDLQRSL